MQEVFEVQAVRYGRWWRVTVPAWGEGTEVDDLTEVASAARRLLARRLGRPARTVAVAVYAQDAPERPDRPGPPAGAVGPAAAG